MSGNDGPRVFSPTTEIAQVHLQWMRDKVDGPWVRTGASFGGPCSRLQIMFLMVEFVRSVESADFEKFRAVCDDPHLRVLMDAVQQVSEAYAAVQAACFPALERWMDESGLGARIVRTGPGGA